MELKITPSGQTIVKPTALGPVANTNSKLLIYGLFQKGRVLAQDGMQSQRGRHGKAKTTAEVWAYYRSCGIEAGPAACATAGRLPEYASCIRCKELIGPNGCVNEHCREHDCTWLNELSGEPDEGDL